MGGNSTPSSPPTHPTIGLNSIIQMTFENNDLDFDRFKAALDESIQRHAPIKKRYVRVKQALFLNKKINEEIMKR